MTVTVCIYFKNSLANDGGKKRAVMMITVIDVSSPGILKIVPVYLFFPCEEICDCYVTVYLLLSLLLLMMVLLLLFC
jgi:hypothetical protein